MVKRRVADCVRCGKQLTYSQKEWWHARTSSVYCHVPATAAPIEGTVREVVVIEKQTQ